MMKQTGTTDCSHTDVNSEKQQKHRNRHYAIIIEIRCTKALGCFAFSTLNEPSTF